MAYLLISFRQPCAASATSYRDEQCIAKDPAFKAYYHAGEFRESSGLETLANQKCHRKTGSIDIQTSCFVGWTTGDAILDIVLLCNLSNEFSFLMKIRSFQKAFEVDQ